MSLELGGAHGEVKRAATDCTNHVPTVTQTASSGKRRAENPEKSPMILGSILERETGLEPATLSLGS